MIARSQWKTHGVAAHFIGSCECRYRLCTVVGCVVVSTVGDYHPLPKDDGSEPPMHIGANRFYETMVFPYAGARSCDSGEVCSCQGMPNIEASRQLDFDGYSTALEASVGHDAMCERWADDEMQRRGFAPTEEP